MMRKRRVIAEVGEEEQRRAGQMSFKHTQSSAEHERALSDSDSWPASESAIHLCHDAGARFVAHEHGPNSPLMIVQGIEERERIASRQTEDHIDARLFQYPNDCLTGRDLFLEQKPCAPTF